LFWASLITPFVISRHSRLMVGMQSLRGV
jgi:hypothetical protein